MQKLWVKIAAVVVAVVLLAVILIPFLVNAEAFRPLLQDKLTAALGRKVTFGHLSFSLLSGTLNARDIAIADDPAFSASPFLQAKELAIGVETWPLVFGHQVRITKLTIDSPSIQLIQTKAGIWNFSSIGGASAAPSQPQKGGAPEGAVITPPSTVAHTAPPQPQKGGAPDLTVADFRIKNGSATVSSLPARGKPFVYSGIELSAQSLSATASFPFDLKAVGPDKGTVDLKGNAGPLAQNNAVATPFSASLAVKHFDPVAAGVIDPSQGISMILDVNAQAASDGKELTSNGKIVADRLHLAKTGSPAPRPVDIDYKTSLNLTTRAGKISDIALHAGQVAAHVKGGFQLTGEGATLDLHLSAPNLPIDQLEQLLPAVGVTLPKGSSLQGGTITAGLEVKGPATAPVIEGPVQVDNTKLAGFDIGSKMQGINPFGGSGGGTTIQQLRADVTSTAQSTQFANISANLPQVGTATGKGSISATEALDFQMMANFNPGTGVGAIAGNAVKSLFSFAGKYVKNKTNGAIPVVVAGTASDPKISVKLGQMFSLGK